MKTDLMKVSCAPDCGFAIQSHDGSELKKMVITHAKNQHGKSVTEKDVESMWKRA
jgi:predicted small metal-binding protein